MEMDNMVEASGLHAETKGKWNVGGRTLPVIACYVHNLPTIQYHNLPTIQYLNLSTIQ